MLLSGTSPSLIIDEKDLSRRLLALQEETGYDIMQKQGQRIFGGPPPGWTGPPPGRGTEIYCYRIPRYVLSEPIHLNEDVIRDCFEDELVPLFMSVGKIYELRLMIEFSGTNRTYCYVRYCTENDAKEAVRRLHNYRIRSEYPLAVTISVDNRRLVARLVPNCGRTEAEVGEELRLVGVEGVSRVWLRGSWLQLEFETHRFAALARRHLVPGSVRLWGRVEVRGVEWAEPKTVVSTSKGRVLCARNIPPNFSYSRLVDIFNQLSNGQVDNVMRVGSMTLVTLLSNEAASLVKQRSVEGMTIAGEVLKVEDFVAPSFPRRRVDRGYVAPSVKYSSSWSPLMEGSLASSYASPRLSNLEDFIQRAPAPEEPKLASASPGSLVSACDELRRLCLSQGWGAPSLHLTGQRVATSGLQVEFQASVMVIGLPTLLNGPWCLTKEDAKATAASAALCRILQGAFETKQADFELGNKSPQGGRVLEDLHTNIWSTHKEVASRGDTVSGRDAQPEQGIIGANLKKQHCPFVDEDKVVGQGSRARRGIKVGEEMGRAWDDLALSPQEGVFSGNGDNKGVDEGEAQQADTLAHGIRGMEEFGKIGPSSRWSRRDDFGGEELSNGFYNFCI